MLWHPSALILDRMEQVKEDLEKTPPQTLFKWMYAELVTFFQDESQVALSGVFLPSEGHLAVSGDIFDNHEWRGQCYWNRWVDVKDAAKHPTVHKAVPIAKNHPAKMTAALNLRNRVLGHRVNHESAWCSLSLPLMFTPSIPKHVFCGYLSYCT